ncbi:hypothetical protein vseg_000838 [Gypsophila vaccaria]
MTEYDLLNNKWLAKLFEMRLHWIPAYQRDLLLRNILRTIQKSESANNFYKRFENKYGTLVEFWMRFETTVDKKRHAQKMLDHENAHSLPKKLTRISLEMHAAEIYTMKVFSDFQDEVDKSVMVCGVCGVCGFNKLEQVEVSLIRDATIG